MRGALPSAVTISYGNQTKKVYNMVFSDLLTLIGSYAFPIVMCVAFFWKLDKEEERHKEEMDKITEALHNNTLAIQHLADTMESENDAV